MSEDTKTTGDSSTVAAKEQPWKKLWPPKAAVHQGGVTEAKAMPWLTWEPRPDDPDEKPWVQWMNDGIYNPEVAKREASGDSSRAGVYPTRKRSDSAVTVAEGG